MDYITYGGIWYQWKRFAHFEGHVLNNASTTELTNNF